MNQHDTTSSNPVIILGNSLAAWGALAHFGQLKDSASKVIWIPGLSSRMSAPLSSLDLSFGGEAVARTLGDLSAAFGVDAGEFQVGSFLREFRNKAFRTPHWFQTPTLPLREQTRMEVLWPSEVTLGALAEGRFAQTVGELEEKIQKAIEQSPPEWFLQNVEYIPGIPAVEIKSEDKKVTSVVLGSGRELTCSQVIYADRWSEIAKIKGFPKAMAFTHKRDAVGALQIVFAHSHPLAQGVIETFMIPLQRESGEEQERHGWGYFSEDGLRSFWTICLSTDESEDNHEIAKKIRRLKSALNKAFCGESWLPQGVNEFTDTISQAAEGEQFRFEENAFFTQGVPPEAPVLLHGLDGICFLTDGYGPACSLAQVSALSLGVLCEFSRDTVRTYPESESVNIEMTV